MDLNDLGKMNMDIKILKNKEELSANVTQAIDGQSVTNTDTVHLIEGGVRAELTSDILDTEEINQINVQEALILHAMTTEKDPELNFSSGINLTAVRSVKAYTIGYKETDMGSFSIVEAKDAEGKNLGTFLGGFIVAPCK